ncbi:MAG: hypothetical protein RIC52_17595 [Amphiplicatus sp.]
MRYAVDLGIFVVVFILGLMIFKSAAHGLLAAMLVAGAAESLLWTPPKR